MTGRPISLEHEPALPAFGAIRNQAGRIATFLGLILTWELLVRLLEVAPFILPPPSAVALRVYSDLATGLIIPHFLVTLFEVTAGFAGAATIAVMLGTAIALSPAVERIVYPYVLVLQTIPKIAVAPLFLIWFGYGMEAKAVTAGLVAFLPILINVIAGLKAVDERRLLLMRALNASTGKTFLKLRLPNMLPYLFAGLESGIIFAVLGAVLGEFIGGSRGLGSLIIQRQAGIDVSGVFSAVCFLSLMGLSLSMLIRLAKRRLAFW